MDRQEELTKARDLARQAMLQVDRTMKALNEANTWGMFDMVGGGMISNIRKRKRINRANEAITEMRLALNQLQEALIEPAGKFPPEVRNSVQDNFLNLSFDDIFVKVRFQGDIYETMQGLSSIKSTILLIDQELERAWKEIN